MDFFDALQISSSGLTAQRLRMNLISGNLANISTTRTERGGPYRRKEPIFAAQADPQSFKDILSSEKSGELPGVEILEVVEDRRPPRMKYDPTHPHANNKGYVAMPNINLMEEMVNLISATRSYEANANAVKAAKEMALKALEIGR
jgi:flagellar basal-body rod protein FlgC